MLESLFNKKIIKLDKAFINKGNWELIGKYENNN